MDKSAEELWSEIRRVGGDALQLQALLAAKLTGQSLIAARAPLVGSGVPKKLLDDLLALPPPELKRLTAQLVTRWGQEVPKGVNHVQPSNPSAAIAS